MNPRVAALLAAAGLAMAGGAAHEPAKAPEARSAATTGGASTPDRQNGPRAPTAIEQFFRAAGLGAIRPKRETFRKKPGWTNASYRRAALKRRNVLRNRKAHARVR